MNENRITTHPASRSKEGLGPVGTIAQVVSDLFCPMLMPVYAMLVAVDCTVLHALPASTTLAATLMVGIITGLVPFLLIGLLIYMGAVSDRSVSNRRERLLPFSVSACCYVTAAFYLNAVHAPLWLTLFPVGATLTVLFAIPITKYWKISAHSASAGGLCAFFLWLAISHQLIVYPVCIVTGSIFIAGLIGTSRLILGRHTIMQVAAGTLLGFICMYSVLTIFCK